MFVGTAALGLVQEPGQRRGGRPSSDTQKDSDDSRPSTEKADSQKRAESNPEPPPVKTTHEIQINGKTLKYTAETGMMPIRDAEGATEANVFFISYTVEPPAGQKRPLMFSFNGGPGSASVWLHLGALGPKRVVLPDDAKFAKPPFSLVDNKDTWLQFTDLVFIDPVGTGFSRAVRPELNKKFHSMRGDIDSVAEFIRMYLTRNDRWGASLYLVGESYGTLRAAGLSDRLVDQGIALNGIILVSTVLNYQTSRFSTGNDLPYIVFLPTYAATAWYHKKLPESLQSRPLRDFLDEVERWAVSDYARALDRGDRLEPDARRNIAEQLAAYTGLTPEYVDNSNLRIEIQRFCKELLRDRKRTVGRLDTRYTGIDETAVEARPEVDPSMSAIRAPYTATFADYVRKSLKYETDRPYFILGEGVGNWDYGLSGGGFPDTSAAMRDAIAKNPFMNVFVASGYYDLATPYFAAEYSLSHMGLDPEQRALFSGAMYEAGHMMYVHSPSLEKLTKDASAFIDKSR